MVCIYIYIYYLYMYTCFPTILWLKKHQMKIKYQFYGSYGIGIACFFSGKLVRLFLKPYQESPYQGAPLDFSQRQG